LGSTSAALVKHLPAGRGRTFALMGSTLSFKDEPQDNDNALFTFEHRMPAGSGVPPHRESNHEAFYVLEGVLEVEAEGSRYRLQPGDFLNVRPGVVHALHSPGPGWMRVLTTVSPGVGHVRFFSTAGEPVDDPLSPPESGAPTDPDRVIAIARECGIEFLPPPSSR